MGDSRRALLYLGLLLLVLLLLAACATAQRGGGWDRPVAKIEETLSRSLAAYEAGDREQARQLAQDAYYEVFESSGLEIAIRRGISSQRAFEVEQAFAGVRQGIRSGASASQVRAQAAQPMAMVREDVARLQGRGQATAMSGLLASFLIVVREGFEAILIIGAIIAYLIKSGNPDKVRTIYWSAALAILASVATAVAVRYLFRLSGASREFLEGATMLLAVAVLFTVSFWLLSKVQAQKWQQYIQSKVGRSLTTGSALTLGSAAFLAVYREGAETVLFYRRSSPGRKGGTLGPSGWGSGPGRLCWRPSL